MIRSKTPLSQPPRDDAQSAPHAAAPRGGASMAPATSVRPPSTRPPSSRPPPLPPVVNEDGTMTTAAKLSLADLAMQLRDEQLEARVIHYKAELTTSPELDKITQQVIAELQHLQQVARSPSLPPPTTIDRAQLEIELIQNLKVMLSRLFRTDKVASVIERKVAEASKRFARLFFESELHEKLRGSTTEIKTMRFPEQALFHVLSRNENYLLRQLEAFDYVDDMTLVRAKELLSGIIRTNRDEFLGRTTPELNILVKYLNEVLFQFFTHELPPATGEIAWEVVREARLADARIRAGYKISADAFPPFRVAFERRFVVRLVSFAEDEMLKRVREIEGKFRQETIRFVADPQIFSDVCELVCDAVYDYLYNDGFLDLPADWRARLLKS